MLTLRNDQEEALEAVRVHLKRGRRRVLLQAPTGFGKTVVASTMAKNAVEKGKRVWMLVHRRELVRQVSKAFSKCDLPHGIVSAGYPSNRFHAAQVCSIPTLIHRLDRYQAPDVIIFDEAHHIGAGSWAKIAQEFPNAVHIGLSATPIRLDGVGLGEFFDELVEGPAVRWLIDNSFLAPIGSSLLQAIYLSPEFTRWAVITTEKNSMRQLERQRLRGTPLTTTSSMRWAPKPSCFMYPWRVHSRLLSASGQPVSALNMWTARRTRLYGTQR